MCTKAGPNRKKPTRDNSTTDSELRANDVQVMKLEMLVHIRFLLFCALWVVLPLTACNEHADPPEDMPTFCEQNPCDEACVEPNNPPTECMDPQCDALCDPCAADCTACLGTCSERFVGPALEAQHCEATLIEDGSDGTTRWEIAFRPASDAPSWLFSLWAGADRQLVAVEWKLPDSSTIDLETWLLFNDHQQNISPSMVSLLSPIAPAYQDLVQAGEHTIVVDVEGSETPCWRVTAQLPPQSDLPYRLRVRLVAVGTEYVDPQAMRDDPLFIEALTRAQAQFAEAGIELYVHEWVVANQTIRNEFAVVDDAEHARNLLEILPASDRKDAITELSVDVALIDRFSEEPDLVGLTGGLPGPVALHSHQAAGVVLSTALLPFYRGPEQIAKILAHELGHYLGLRHTTSWPNLGFDPLDDTPECPQSVFTTDSNACPDAYNMMFPSLSMQEAHWWSEEQMQVMRWHPAVTQRTD